MATTSPLAWHDLQWCLRRAPRELLYQMKKHGPKIMVAGGYIRSCIGNETINDVDVFVPSKEFGRELAMAFAENDPKRLHETDNAFTVKGYRIPIQIIHRWTFESPDACILSFDFTIARAAFWWNGEKWESAADPRFYPDLAGKRLIYCAPQRIEETGGSMLRVLKFYQRGYRIPLDSLGAVMARACSGVEGLDKWDTVNGAVDERRLAKVLSGLLREVDPNIDPSHIAHLPSENTDEQIE